MVLVPFTGASCLNTVLWSTLLLVEVEMAYLNPNEAFEHFSARVSEGIRANFPVRGRTLTLSLEDLSVEDKLHPDDIRSQHKAKVEGATWAVPVFATVALRDNKTREVIDRQTVKLTEIPKMTRRYSYIVDGQEYQVDNQWQLKPGVYAKRRQNGELEAQFNVTGRSAFDMVFDPDSKQFVIDYKKAKLPAYPLMKTLGVTDEQLEKSWGKEILDANRNAKRTVGAVEQFYKTSTGQAPASKQEAENYLREAMESSKLRSEVTKITLGKAFDSVNGEALHLASNKLLKVQAGHPEDDRDDLVFKDLRAVGDYANDRLHNLSRTITLKVQRQLNSPKTKSVRDVIRYDVFTQPIRQLFTKNAAARTASQINPLEMVSSSMQTTIMGPGGIKSERSITDEAKMINPSHLGYIDPINTPEGSKTGVTLRLPIGVRKVGNDACIPAYNMRTGKTDYLPPSTFATSKVVLPDQVEWKDGKPHPLSDAVHMVHDGDIKSGRMQEADFVLKHPSQAFNITSNLIPFVNNNSGGRAGYASRQMEQAISLVHRQAPLVQVATPSGPGGTTTFERLVGHQASHASPVTGTVKSVSKDAIVVQDKEGQDHEVQLYHNYPLNDAKGVLHSTPTVKKGDRVTSGQLVADTNFSQDGHLALGTNLRVAYLPYKGYNFEDGVVISQDAAKRLSSEHLHKHFLRTDKLIFDPKKYQAMHPGAFKPEQFAKLDEKGIVKVGQKVKPGDPLVVAMQPFEIKDRVGLAAIRKSMSGHHTDKAMRWDGEFEGEVVGVHNTATGMSVHVRTIEPMQVGDKLSNRHGGKGIVTMILPDHEMPHTKDGKPIHALLNPAGVPGRINVGQVFETAAAKVAEKTGKTYVVDNFNPKIKDQLEHIKGQLKTHGLSDQEEVIEPLTGHSLGKALVGPHYVLKLVHQVDKKLASRAGMGLPGVPSEEGYDLNLQPAGGGHSGGKSMGILGMYGLLAHGAKANIREMQTWKSEGFDPRGEAKRWPSQHLQVWQAIQEGTPLPPPTSTFAFHKFTQMLKGSGVNIEKRGHEMLLSPLTDKDVLRMSGGELKDGSRAVRSKVTKQGEYQPITGGIFDERATGGHGGTKWSHISLAEPIPNPVFENAIKHLTGLTKTEMHDIIVGEKGVHPISGALVEPGKGITGGAGIKHLLEKIDVKTELPKLKQQLASAPSSKVDGLLKKVKYMSALQKFDMTPAQAYVLHHLPVLPPVIRPLTVMSDGNVKYEDVNGLYMQFAQTNNQLKDPVLAANLTDKRKKRLREEMYDGVKALIGVGTINKDRKEKGLLEQIHGSQPKEGYFQNTLINRRQDLTMRSTIVPEPHLGLDEVGIPKDAALTLFRPFVVRQLVLQGTASNAMDAQMKLAAVHKGKEDPMVWKALNQVMSERPVLLKRDPVLHKYGVQSFKPRVVEGSAIKIHPLVCSGYNADFDGDTMTAFVPISHEAVREAEKMFPSNNVFNEASGKVMYHPTMESALGLFKLSRVGKQTQHKFSDQAAAAEALREGKIHYTDVVDVGGMKTTAGRILIAGALPSSMQHRVLTDMGFRVDKKGLNDLLTEVGKEHRHEFGRIANNIKDVGYGAAFGLVKSDMVKGNWIPVGTHSLSLDDFTPDKKMREQVLAETKKKVDAVYASGSIPARDKDRRAVDLWNQASARMKELHTETVDKNPTNLYVMSASGTKPSWDQYKQLVLAPMIAKDSKDRPIPFPITKSYAEGLDLAGYWTQLHGARRGAVMKVQEVQEPGYMSKLLMNTSMNLLVDKHDCGTEEGLSLPVSEKDVHDRHLAKEFKAGNLMVPAGTLLTPDIIGHIKAADKNARVVVRSPLKCESEKGLCQKCMGPSVNGSHHHIGTNIGVLAAHALGERAVQLTLKSFHTGGIQEAGGGSKIIGGFARFEQLTKLPSKIPNSATIAMTSGKIEKVEKDPTGVKVWVNGQAHHVGRDENGMPLHEPLPGATQSGGYTHWVSPKVGEHVDAGAVLSDPNRTVVNPHTLYKATRSIERVQNHLADEIYTLYKDEGVRRRSVEAVVKAMSNLTKIVDPGDHDHILRGEFHPTSVIRKLNETELKGKRPVLHQPVLMGVDMLPLSLHEDWMAKLQHQRLRGTICDAASMGLASNLHGSHPIPGMAYGAEFGMPQLARSAQGTVAPHHY